jgi:hypothetical protein
MFFIPGMRPGHTVGAAGTTARQRSSERIVAGSAFRGTATPRGLVPYEEPKGPSAAAMERKREARRRDIAEALHAHRDTPNSARERLAQTYADAESVPVD